jgi:hypothetical protein
LLHCPSRIFGLGELYNERERYNGVLEKSKIVLNEKSARYLPFTGVMK